MALHFGSESTPDLEMRLVAAAGADLTYPMIGMSLGDGTPAGYRQRTFTTSLGWGPGVFDRAVQALHGWQAHRGAGILVAADGPIAVGTNVVLAVPFGPARVEAECRIVAMIEETDRYGFAYGTLPNHPVQGEESFVVEKAANGYVSFAIHAVSKLHQPLANAFPPVARRLQGSYTKRYLRAMERAVGLTDQ